MAPVNLVVIPTERLVTAWPKAKPQASGGIYGNCRSAFPFTLFPRADSGPGGRALLVGFVGMITRSIPPSLCRSSLPQIQPRRDTKSPLSLRFRVGAKASVEARGRRGAYGACGLCPPAVAQGFCYGPRTAASCRPQADAI